MRYIRPKWLDLVLVLSIVLLVTFLAFHNRLASTSPWLSIWPNVLTDLFGIWLGVRIIDSIINERERRRTAALSIRGTLNYTMQRARDLLPRPGWPLWILRDEIRWLRLRLDLQPSLIRDSERRFAEAAIRMLESITVTGDRLKSLLRQVDSNEEELKDEFERATERDPKHVFMYRFTPLRQVQRYYRFFADDPDADTGPLIVAIKAARNSSAPDNLSTSVAEAIQVYLAAIDSVIDARTELKREVDGYITFVRDAETRILSKHATDSE